MVACDVLVVGGSGRVGASTLRWLERLSTRADGGASPLRLASGGRSIARFKAAQRRLNQPDLAFVEVDLGHSVEQLTAAVRGVQLVVHTAGPFQGRSQPRLLEACIAAGVAYCDVCDEWPLSQQAKQLSAAATAAGIPAVVSGGIWPGASALMAAEAVDRLGGPGSCDQLELSFFTAGTGGAGPTIVSATFLLLAEKALTLSGGELSGHPAWSGRRSVDFGSGVGRRACFLLDNPDVPSTAAALQISDCASRFGTAPALWNQLFAVMQKLPKSLLRNRQVMHAFSLLSMPVIRVVDAAVGSTNAMRIDAHGGGGSLTLRCVHPSLEDCVGQATAAFALEVLRGRTSGSTGVSTIPAGVWFPAELNSLARRNILEVVREKALIWEL
jgi:saccharopine dehydrogenase-like NADP-dependent oxidoreductase